MTRFVARLIVATRRFVRDKCGATLAEYALDVALISLVAGGGATILGTGISNLFGNIATGLNSIMVNPIAVQPRRDHQRPDGGGTITAGGKPPGGGTTTVDVQAPRRSRKGVASRRVAAQPQMATRRRGGDSGVRRGG
ncbi:MAG: Flp family type IVb pilin [Planctomycetaceae bacterium]|nr:Flp family type IVb pilin [Planctomycetaceae bacterium]